MNIVRKIATSLIVFVALVTVGAGLFIRTDYSTQYRDILNAAPSRQHLLGTDDLGRDRLLRVIYGTKISLTLAPVAALLSVGLAASIGGLAGYLGGIWERAVTAGIELFLCLPWLFLLVAIRAMMPLNVSPFVSVVVTFCLLGGLGWAASARVVCAGVRSIRESDFVLRARAAGTPEWRVLFVHILPNVRPVLIAQFLVSVPVFILTEANLGVLGLGVAEPLPSWGSLLRELETMYGFTSTPWKLVPLALLVVVVISFQFCLSSDEVTV